MEAVYVLGGFGLSSIFYAVGGYLNELCIYLDNMGHPGFFQKVLVVLSVTCFILSIPALSVFYPLQNLLLKRMERYWRRDERERLR